MARKTTGNVRIGPISFLVLISVIMLAVMAVLCLTTARASYVMADRQTTTVTNTYALDTVGQRMVAQVDAGLATQRAAEASLEDALAYLNANAGLLSSTALRNSGTDGLTATASVQNNQVLLTVSASEGRMLSAVLTINENLTYSITDWKMSVTQEQTQESLWSGDGAK